MDGWTCEECGRLFGRNNQLHDCAPGLSLEEYFETGPEFELPIFEELMNRLDGVGPIHLDVVSVGIFLKNPHQFAQVRPRTRWVAISFGLRRRAAHPTITRKVNEYGGRFWHVANIRTPDDIDDDLVELLAEAYHETAG